MADYKLISADSHFVEPPKMWAERLDRRFRDRAPHAGVDPTVTPVANLVRPLAPRLRSEKPGFWRAVWLSTNR